MPISQICKTDVLREIYEWRQWRIALIQLKKLEAAEKEAAKWRPVPTWRIEYSKPRPAFDTSARLNIVI